MVVLLADTADNSPVPPVPLPPVCKDGGAALELDVFRPTDGRASYVRIDDKSSDGIAGSAERDISKYSVELIQLQLSAGIFHNAPVLPEDAKVEALNSREHDERCLTRGGRKLF